MTDPRRLLLVNGPNLNLLGAREPGVYGTQTLADIEALVAATAAGALVVYTQDWHPGDTPHFAKDGGTWPVHCVQDTWGAQLHPRLDVRGDVVRKGENGEDGYSGFTMKDPSTEETVPTRL